MLCSIVKKYNTGFYIYIHILHCKRKDISCIIQHKIIVHVLNDCWVVTKVIILYRYHTMDRFTCSIHILYVYKFRMVSLRWKFIFGRYFACFEMNSSWKITFWQLTSDNCTNSSDTVTMKMLKTAFVLDLNGIKFILFSSNSIIFFTGYYGSL